MIRGIKLPEGIRFIQKKDLEKPFSSKEPLINRFNLKYYYDEHKRKDRAAIVKVRGGDIVCIALIYINYYPENFRESFVNEKNSIYVDLISNNNSSGKVIEAEGLLMLVDIGTIALNLDKKYVFLEADGSELERLLKYYKEIGFKELQEKYYSEEWGGWLQPLYILAKDLANALKK